MSHHPYGARATLRALTGLDIGLRVRVQVQSSQRTIFSGTENRAALQLISELAREVSRLRVYSYGLRGQLEEAVSALQLNAACGSWRYARRAALDLSGLLGQAGRRRLADRGLCVRAANVALRTAELCGREVR